MTNPRQERSEGLFRRRRFIARRKRRGPVARLLRPFASSVAIVILPAVFVWWVLSSPQLLVGEVVVGATDRVDAGWVEKRLEPLHGRHVLSVRLDEVERRLADHPWIDTVEMRKELPGRLEVEIRQRRPVALSRTASAAVYLDASGRAIAEADGASQAAGLVIVEGLTEPRVEEATKDSALAERALQLAPPGLTRRAIELAAEWSRLRPGETVSRVEILNPRTFRIHSDSLPFAVLLGDGRLDLPLARFDSVAKLVAESYPEVKSVDLRFSRQIVFQTAAELPTREG